MKKLSEIEITEEIREKASKCTTAEELTALAQEYDVELTQEETGAVLEYNNRCKELNDEQLDKVAGGQGGDNKGNCLPPNHGPRISKYAEGYVGRKVYCVDDNHTDQFCLGTLVASYEGKGTLWTTERVHDILIEKWNHDTDQLVVNDKETYSRVPAGQILHEIDSQWCTLFLYDNKGSGPNPNPGGGSGGW